MSKEFYKPTINNKNKVGLVLIQGTGAVRAGIWARSVAINENFYLGTMLPQVYWAQSNGIPILIMNPNYLQDPNTKEKIPLCQTMQAHTSHVW